ncbi:hypothetical protein [Salinisphaera japonica]|nr:hypothetical protein [Salinisphaera japonica]
MARQVGETARWNQGLLPFRTSPRQALFYGKTRRSTRRAVVLR